MYRSESENYMSSTDEEKVVSLLRKVTKRRRTIAGPDSGGLVEDDELREEALILQLKQYEASAKEKDREIERLKHALSEVERPLGILPPVSPDIAWICETLENAYLKHSLSWQTRLEPLSVNIIPSKVGKYIRQAGRSSEEVKYFVQWLKTIIMKSLKDVQSLWLGYEPQNDEPIFVAMVDKLKDDLPTQVMNFKVMQRVIGQVSDEAKDVILKEKELNLTFSAGEQLSIGKCLAKFSTSLMRDHSNLTIVSASKIKSVKHGSKDALYKEMACIVLYVDVKGVIPFHGELFPNHLDDIPVDVREGTFKTYGRHPAEYHEHLMMGCQIVTDYKTCATLGGFLQMENKTIACLTCCHLFETPESIADFCKDPRNVTCLKKDVYQPFPVVDHKIGKLSQFIKYAGDENNIGVDAALIEISDPLRYPQSGNFPNAESYQAGFSPENPMLFNSGEVIKCLDEVPIPCNVVKYGASTGHTIGTIRLFGPAVHAHTTSFRPEDNVRLHQQFEVISSSIEPFSDEGDSGSLVFLCTDIKSGLNIRAVGLLVGGTDYGTTIVTPIWAVLSKFNLPLKLLAFESESFLLPPRLPRDSRQEGVEKDVEELKSSMSNLVENAHQTDQKMIVMEAKIDQIGSQTQRTEQNIQNKLDMQHAQLLSLLASRVNNSN